MSKTDRSARSTRTKASTPLCRLLAADIARLRRRIGPSLDPKEAVDFYSDVLAEDVGFSKASIAAGGAPLNAIVREVMKLMGNADVPIASDWSMVPEHHLWHGCFRTEEFSVQVIYFADTNSGVWAAVHESSTWARMGWFSVPAWGADATAIDRPLAGLGRSIN